jgi:organic hydroperoxide reductase OsmC/OhrA
MSEYRAKLLWKRETSDFSYETFDRTHTVTYGGGISLKASSASEYFGKAEYVNPEESLAAAVASCHLLTFLAVAAKSRLIVDQYQDEPVAFLCNNEEGKMAVTQIRLCPKITFGGDVPSPEKIKWLHEKAHKNCFIANSLRCEVIVET